DEMRPLSIQRSYIKHAEGSVLISEGDTRLNGTASNKDNVPQRLRGSSQRWVPAEYSIITRSTPDRTTRPTTKGKVGGRTHELQRLIGRALRSVVDLSAIGERTIWLDCDVIQADGGTRTTSITGAYIALVEALDKLAKRENWPKLPVTDVVAAT